MVALLVMMTAVSAVQAQGLGLVQVVKDVGFVDGLDGTRAVAVSPDGKHVYAASRFDDAVAVFSRDATTGVLTFVEALFDGIGGVDGLDEAFSVAVSPDGAHVYVAGELDDAVAVFSRNAATGVLTFVEALFDGVGNVDGLDGVLSVAVSPDGTHVYTASFADDAVAVFSRNSTTGQLTFVEVLRDGIGGVDGLGGAFSVTVSPDGAHVYAAGAVDNAVAVFSRDATTGALTFVEALFDGVGNVDGLAGARSVTVSGDGQHVYAAGAGDDAVVVFSRNATTGVLTFVEALFDGVGNVDGLDGALSVAVSPDGAHVYAVGLDEDAVAVFSRNSTTGQLTFVEALFDGVDDVDGLDGVSLVTMSPDGAHVYVSGNVDDAVVVFSRNATTGRLTFVEAFFDGMAGVDGLDGARSATVSPDGQHVYAAGGNDDAVVVFSRNATTGQLTFRNVYKDGVGVVDGLDGARSVTVSPDGKNVYAAAFEEDAVAVFSRNVITGALSFTEFEQDGVSGVDGLDGARSATVSPDGKHVYAVSALDDAVVVFSRDATTGALTFVEVLFDDTGSVDGLDGAVSVTVSPDDAHVYVAGNVDDAVAVFSRDSMTGQLTFVEMQKDGVGGVDGLDGASSVIVSGDGAHVYATSSTDDAVAVFSRNATTGQLTFIEMQQDGVGSVDGLDGAEAVTVSPDGQHVYVVSFIDDAVVGFKRNAVTGRLTFVRRRQDGVGVVDGLDGARSVMVSPDAKHVYAASQLDDAVAVFSRLVVRTLYVATTGSDAGNDCRQVSSPCLTLGHAVGQADEGDTVFIAAGVYVEPGLVIDKELDIEGQGVVVR